MPRLPGAGIRGWTLASHSTIPLPHPDAGSQEQMRTHSPTILIDKDETSDNICDIYPTFPFPVGIIHSMAAISNWIINDLD